MYRKCLESWVRYLYDKRHYGPSDALFPKQVVAAKNGRFARGGLSREPYANAQTINRVVKGAFTAAGMHPYTPHSLRKTLAVLMDTTCSTMSENKAWSQNLGHEHLATTVSAYLLITREQQRDLIRSLRQV